MLEQLSLAMIQANRERWGLDKPLFPDQLVAYVQETLTGDLGFSIKYRGQPVTEVVFDAMWPTVLLIGLGEAVGSCHGGHVGREAAHDVVPCRRIACALRRLRELTLSNVGPVAIARLAAWPGLRHLEKLSLRGPSVMPGDAFGPILTSAHHNPGTIFDIPGVQP